MSYFYKKSDTLENLVNKYFAAIEEYNKEKYNGSISIILLGSLSRGEGSFTETENGIKLLSDIEYFTVVPDDFTDFEGYTDYCQIVEKEIFGFLETELFHIDNTFIKKSVLPRMEKKLITYDAKCMGKTVVGNDTVYLLPEINIRNINKRDIKDIVTHRVFYALNYGMSFKEKGDTEKYRYCLAKNSLDLMTVLLVSRGQLASGFIRRFEIIKQLPIDQKIKNYFEYCLSVKLSTDCEYHFKVPEMEEIFLILIKTLNKQFKVCIINDFINIKHVMKRRAGILKRMLKYGAVPSLKHTENLIKRFENKDFLTERDKLNNLILNGYPLK
ncbi:MAG: hypothetical protein E7568_00925 [Ruminococcaceae bacterium]|nr:hypothetical protein [Oscillospiraceae bacterium]